MTALTGTEISRAATQILATIWKHYPRMARYIAADDLEAMISEAVLLADHHYQGGIGDRHGWTVYKGTYIVVDMMRQETRHMVGLTIGELRGVTRDIRGETVKPRRTAWPDMEETIRQLQSGQPPVEALVHAGMLCERFELALDELPDQRAAAAFRLTVWQHWTQADVAELFGISASRVVQLMNAARHHLRFAFADLAADARAA